MIPGQSFFYPTPLASQLQIYPWSTDNPQQLRRLITKAHATLPDGDAHGYLWHFQIHLQDWRQTQPADTYDHWWQQIPERHQQEITMLREPTLLDYLFISSTPNAGSLTNSPILYHLTKDHWIKTVAPVLQTDVSDTAWHTIQQQINSITEMPRRKILELLALQPSPDAYFDKKLVSTLQRLPTSMQHSDLQIIRHLIGAPRGFIQLLDDLDLKLDAADLKKAAMLALLYPSSLAHDDIRELLLDRRYLALSDTLWQLLIETLVTRHKRFAHRKADFLSLPDVLDVCRQSISARASTHLFGSSKKIPSAPRHTHPQHRLEHSRYSDAVMDFNRGIVNHILPTPHWEGTADIIPMTSTWEVHYESDVMKHCIAGHIESLRERKHSAYRVLYPERCTLMLRNTFPPQIEDIRLWDDRFPSAETIRFIMTQLGQFDHRPSALPSPMSFSRAQPCLPHLSIDQWLKKPRPDGSTELLTHNGICKAGKLYSNGYGGFLMYGPYIPLGSGDYIVSIQGEIYSTSQPDSILLDVTTDSGGTQIIATHLPDKPGSFNTQLHFSLHQAHASCEIRISVKDRTWMMISSIQLERLYIPAHESHSQLYHIPLEI